MIYIKDNFISNELIDEINNDNSDFTEVIAGDKSFWVKQPSEEFILAVYDGIEQMEGKDIDVILSFAREARNGQDDDWRIHNDAIINGEQPDRAAVLYISEPNSEVLNGTAFWEHKELGEIFECNSQDDFNKVLIEDSNDLKKWRLKSVIGHKKNRIISYPCNYFHSKFPDKFNESRVVFVVFYKLKNK